MNESLSITLRETYESSKKYISQYWLTLLGIGMLLRFLYIYLGYLLLTTGYTLGKTIFTSGKIGSVIGFAFVILCVGTVYSLLQITRTYVVARRASQSINVFRTTKQILRLRNLELFAMRVFLPQLVFASIGLIVTFLIRNINPYLLLAWVILFIAMVVVISYRLTGPFIVSLYAADDNLVTETYTSLLAEYDKRTLRHVYLNQLALTLLFSVLVKFLLPIPIVGLIVLLGSEVVVDGITGGTMTLFRQRIGLDAPIKEVEERKMEQTTVSLINDDFALTVDLHGAQIISLSSIDGEYMWQRNPEFWGKTSPVLFPFVGKLKDDKYSVNGKTIEMNQHGFLRDRKFKLSGKTRDQLRLEYTSNLEDFERYPFDFTVAITYTLRGRKIETEYEVTNNGNLPMPYQIGAHPAFNVESVDDLKLVFPSQTATKHLFAGGLQTSTETIELEEVDLSYEVINNNLPCYSDMSDRQVMLYNGDKPFINFEFDTMTHIAIWSPEEKNAKFVCIEPWYGICSRTDQVGYDLADKDAMHILEPKNTERCSYSFEVLC